MRSQEDMHSVKIRKKHSSIYNFAGVGIAVFFRELSKYFSDKDGSAAS